MEHTKQTYDMAIAANAHTGLEKPSFEEWKKIRASYQQKDSARINRIKRVQRITADLVREVMTDEHNKTV